MADLERLQGTWTIVALEIDGVEMPSGGSKIVVEGDRFTTVSMGATYNGDIALYPSKKPKAFDLNFTAGPEKGNTSFGIYELNGDQWKICLTVTGKSRPQAFATQPGSGLALETLRRDTTTASAKTNIEVHFEPVAELQGEWSLMSLTLNGTPVDAARAKYGKRVVDGDRMTLTFGKDLVTTAKMDVDPAVSPKIMDYVHIAGMLAGTVQQGIYELQGKNLKVCSSPPGQPRPSDFTATPENRRTLAVWKLAGG
jgi:uncharacterized protein (TIGR03067 family)